MHLEKTMKNKSFIIIFALSFFCFLCRCGGMDPEEEKPPKILDTSDRHLPYCGDYRCDEGENYLNCSDCNSPYVNPWRSYCGDGICFEETLRSCYIDCKPQYKPEKPPVPSLPSLTPPNKPKLPIPIPDPIPPVF